MDERFYTVEELAAVARVSPATVRYWLRNGRLRGVKLGNQWRIRHEDAEAFIIGEPDSREEAREARLRRLAKRQGLILEKWHGRNPEDPRWQRFWIAREQDRWMEAGGDLGLNLDEVERFLTEG